MSDQSVTWKGYWPEWVPDRICEQVEQFYTWHNGVDGYRRAQEQNQTPDMGEVVLLPVSCGGM